MAMQNIKTTGAGFLENENDAPQRLPQPVDGLIYQFRYFPKEDRFSIPFASKGLWNIYELTFDEIKNNAPLIFERIHKDDLASVHAIINDSMQDIENKTYEYRVVLPSKGVRWLRNHAFPIKMEDDSYLWNCYVMDITEKKEKESKIEITSLRKQNRRLLDFAHIVSHNLNAISSNFEMLLEMIDETNDPKEKFEMMNFLRIDSKKLSNTITHLDEIVSVQDNINKKLEKINLIFYSQKAIDILKPDIDQKKAIIINQIPADIFLNYNPNYLESILLNIISNALKYKHPDRNPEIKLEAFYEKERLVLQISDNGIGIDLDKYGKNLFGMYKTFHENKDAVGIGLFIVKNQVESMGGEITIESEVNIGTSFKVYFT